MLRRTCILLAAPLALAGCNLLNKEEAQKDDASNPYYKQAQQDLDNKKPDAAVVDYETALNANPRLAGANYELGVIYAGELNDPISSIYHFKRFLELAPQSDKAGQARQSIAQQSQAFVASLPNPGSSDDAKLQSDNAALKQQVDDATNTIAQLQAQLAKIGKRRGHLAMQAAPPEPQAAAPDTGAPSATPDASALAATPPATAAPANVAPAEPPRAMAVDTNAPNFNANPTPPPGATNAPGTPSVPARSYTVVKGDSLWKIAHKMYPGDTLNGEDKIRDANKDAMSGKFLKPGQVLVIP